MVEGYIGRPYSDCGGRIREVMVNYQTNTHEAVRSCISAMPHASFIVFCGSSPKEQYGQYKEKRGALIRSGHRVQLDYWERMLGCGDTSVAVGYYNELLGGKRDMEMSGDTDNDIYRAACTFLEMAASWHYHNNFNLGGGKYEKYSAKQLKGEFPGQVELVRVGYPIHNYARDAVLSLSNGGRRLIVPGVSSHSGGLMSMLGSNYERQADDPVWERRGYVTGERLDLEHIAGGAIVSSENHIFLGVNPWSYRTDNDDREKGLAQVMRFAEGLEMHQFWHPSVINHIDVYALPGDDGSLYIADPFMTADMLSSHVDIGPDMKFMERHFDFCGRLREHCQYNGFRTTPIPFWVADYGGLPTMFSYANALKEPGKVYVGRKSDMRRDRRLAEIGKALDDRFFRAASADSEVHILGGFQEPSVWTDSGLRCVANVVMRE